MQLTELLEAIETLRNKGWQVKPPAHKSRTRIISVLEGIVEGIVQAREPTWSADQKQAFLNGLADAARAAIAKAKGEENG
jgi:hypothetical protein